MILSMEMVNTPSVFFGYPLEEWLLATSSTTWALYRNCAINSEGFEFNSVRINMVYKRTYVRICLVQIGDFDVFLFRILLYHVMCVGKFTRACVFMKGERMNWRIFSHHCMYFYFIHRCQFVSHPIKWSIIEW